VFVARHQRGPTLSALRYRSGRNLGGGVILTRFYLLSMLRGDLLRQGRTPSLAAHKHPGWWIAEPAEIYVIPACLCRSSALVSVPQDRHRTPTAPPSRPVLREQIGGWPGAVSSGERADPATPSVEGCPRPAPGPGPGLKRPGGACLLERLRNPCGLPAADAETDRPGLTLPASNQDQLNRSHATAEFLLISAFGLAHGDVTLENTAPNHRFSSLPGVSTTLPLAAMLLVVGGIGATAPGCSPSGPGRGQEVELVPVPERSRSPAGGRCQPSWKPTFSALSGHRGCS